MEDSKQGSKGKKLQNNQKTLNKMTMISPHLFDQKEFNDPIKRHEMTEWIEKITSTYMQPTGDSLSLKTHTDWNEGKNKNILCKW